MKRIKKIIIVALIISFFATIIVSNSSYAAYDMMNTINKQINTTATGNITNSVQTIAGSIITITRVICAGVAVAMLTLLGVKYMTAAPGEKADIKKHAIPYVVGAVIMFACTGILGIIENFASGF